MTSPTSAASSNRRGTRRGRRGFTLIEMLVVIGIILVILGLTAPALTRAWRAGDRTATASDLQAIALALEAYRQDHGDYPRVRYDSGIPVSPATSDRPNPPTGAQILCQALIAPAPAQEGAGSTATGRRMQDGAEGPGFRIRGTQGRVYGPYLQPGKFKVADPARPNDPITSNTRWLALTIMDRNNTPILYFPASPGKPNIHSTTGGIPGYIHSDNTPSGVQSEQSYFDADDNFDAFRPKSPDTAQPLVRLRKFMGDFNANGIIDGSEKAASTDPFILWSSGPDEAYGMNPTPNSTNSDELYRAINKCDDVTNFRN